jgi:PBP1b-binding outer membrane lipoprotein LpoB
MNIEQTIPMRKFLGLILIIFVFFIGCSNSPSDANSNNSEINKDMVPQPIDVDDLVTPVPLENTDNINKKNFDKIKKGMSQTEVENLIAGLDRRISYANVNGKYIETTRWETADSAKYIEVTYENNKVIDKKEKGL